MVAARHGRCSSPKGELTDHVRMPHGAPFVSAFAKNTAVFSALTLLSRVSGLLRVMAFAAILGSGRGASGRLNDAFQLANTIPNILYEFIMGGVLSAVFIPVLVRAQEKSGKTSPEAWRVANLLMGTVGLILAGVSVLGVLLAPQITWLMTSFSPKVSTAESKELATYFLRFFAPQMLFYGLNAVFMAILNSHKIFAITAAAPILNNIVVLLTLGLYGTGVIDVAGLGVGTTAGVAAMALVQVPWLLKIGMPLRPRFNFRDPVFLGITALGAPVVAVSVANLIGTAIRANLLYTVPGAFTTYTFSFILIMMPYGVFAVSVATVLYPALSRHAAAGELAEFRSTMSLGMRWTTLAMLPVALGLAVLAEPVARVLFERGQFTWSDTRFTASFLRVYALSIFPYALVIFATRVFYSFSDTRTPAWINVGGVVVNVVLNFVLLRWMGAPGIALSSTVTYTLTTIVSLVIIRRRYRGLGGREFALGMGRMALAGLLMALAVSAALHGSRPGVALIAGGPRAPLFAPESARMGNAMLIRDAGSLRKYFEATGAAADEIPPVDFARESFIAVFGPASETTTTLRLESLVRGEDGTATATVAVHRPPPDQRAAPRVIHIPQKPPYLYLIAAGDTREIRAEFRITDSPPPSRWARVLQAPDAVRVVLLVLLGAVVYLVSAWALGVGELRGLLATVRRHRG